MYTMDLLFEEGKVQFMWVWGQWRALCTLSLVVSRSFWSLCDIFWIHLVIHQCIVPVVCSEMVF